MARRRSFDLLARRLVISVLAASQGGCSGIDVDGMEAIACTEDERFDAFGDVSLSESYDSFDLVKLGGYEGDPEVISSAGTRCATATDVASCQAEVDAVILPAPESEDGDPVGLEEPVGFTLGACIQICSWYAIVATRGDEVRVVRDEAGVRSLLGGIDTATEAVWIARLADYSAGCGDATRWGTRSAEDGWEVAATKLTASCEPVETTQFLLSVTESGEVTVLDESVIESESGACVGRRPACPAPATGRGRTHVGAYLSSQAQLEAASVPAFAELGRELAACGAPRSLVRGARRARAEEVVHTRTMRRLAIRHGGSFSRPRVQRVATRPLVEIAVANAREGCVREAFGAVVGRWQATRATDPTLRRVMDTIAREEAGHASLALRVDAWARRRLTTEERQRVDLARTEALRQLRAEIAAETPDPSLVEVVGLPTRAEALALFDRFAAAVATPGQRHEARLLPS